MSPVGMPDGGTQFPIRAYDRPAIALGNLILGDVDSTTRAIFSPMTLSPNEVKSVRKMFIGKEGEKNPILKTAVDLATNPIVIAGLVMMLGPWGKVAKPLELQSLMAEGGKHLKEVSKFMNGLVSPQTAFRRLQNKGVTVWQHMAGMTQASANFQTQHINGWEATLRRFVGVAGRGLTAEEVRAVDMYARGFHTAEAPFALQYKHFLFGKGPVKALTPDLVPYLKKQPGLFDVAKAYSQRFVAIKEQALSDIAVSGKMTAELSMKGSIPVQLLDRHYATRVIAGRTSIEKWLGQGKVPLGNPQKKLLDNLKNRNIRAAYTKARRGNSMPLEADLEPVKNLFDPVLYDKVLAIPTRQTEIARIRLRAMWKDFAQKVEGVMGTVDEDKKISDIVGRMADDIKGKDKYFDSMLKSTGFEKESRERIVEAINEKVVSHVRGATSLAEVDQLVDDVAGIIGMPARFSLDASKVMPTYVKAMAPTYGWHTTGHGPALDYIFNPKSLIASDIERLNFNDGLSLMLRGFKHPKEYARNVLFSNSMMKLHEWTGTSRAKQLIPTGTRKWIREVTGGTKGYISDNTVGGQLASILYNSSLSLNMSPVSKNLMQNFVTTFNLLGAKAMVKGGRRVAGGLSKMAELAPKIGVEHAFRKAFPEYYSQFRMEGITKAMVAGDIAKEGQMIGQTVGKFKKLLSYGMMPFSASEKFNRLLAFYSAHESVIDHNIRTLGREAGKVASREFGRNVNTLTQFTGGPLGLSRVTRGMWAPFRQFTHFPLRYSEFLYNTATGAGPQGSRTAGVLGRTMVGSATAYTVARNMAGVDISGGLAFAALPIPEYEQSPFFPFPLVPPVIGMAGDVGKAIATGDFKNLPGRLGSMIAPGGLAVKRGYKTWAPKYADYKNRTPDGRIPVYNDKGMLLSSQTPMELTMRGLGIHPTSVEAEKDLVKYLLSQREEIRNYRRTYLESLSQNDLEKAGKVNQEFQKKYPTLGEMKVRKSDIKAMQNRKQIARLNRVLKGFPKAYRPLFQGLIEQTQLTQLAQDIDSQSSLAQYLE